jgi:hypothetical protein
MATFPGCKPTPNQAHQPIPPGGTDVQGADIQIEIPGGASSFNIPIPSTLLTYDLQVGEVTSERALGEARKFGVEGQAEIEPSTQRIRVQSGDLVCELDQRLGTAFFQDLSAMWGANSATPAPIGAPITSSPPPDPVVPSEEASKQFAQDYLKRFQLDSVGELKFFQANYFAKGIINGKTTILQREIVYRRYLNDRIVLGPGSQVSVFIGDEGKIIGCFLDWPSVQQGKAVSIKKVDKALDDLRAKLAEIGQLDSVSRYRSFKISEVKLYYLGQTMPNKQRIIIPSYGVKGIADRGQGPINDMVMLTASDEAMVILPKTETEPVNDVPSPAPYPAS